MDVPLELQFKDVEASPELEQRVRNKVARLERFADISSCRVVVEKPHSSPRSGSPYRVRIDVSVPPSHELVADKGGEDADLNDSLSTVINSAFQAVERQLKEVGDRRRGDVKTHAEPIALVVGLHPEDDFGFLKTSDGRDVYFHRNAVLNDDFDRLAVGTQVRFEEASGNEGPQASTVQIIGKPGSRASDEEPLVPPPPADRQR